MNCKLSQHDANMNALQPPPPHTTGGLSTSSDYRGVMMNQAAYRPHPAYHNPRTSQTPPRPPPQHTISNVMGYRDSTTPQHKTQHPQYVRLPPINFDDDPPSPDNGNYGNDRIQNDLLDEICSDIGIKDAIDLDVFDFDVSTDQYIIQQTRLPDDLASLDQTIAFGGEGGGESLVTAPPPRPNLAVKSTHDESIASPTISSSSGNSNKASAGSRPSSVSSSECVHSTTANDVPQPSTDSASTDTEWQGVSDDQKVLERPDILARLGTREQVKREPPTTPSRASKPPVPASPCRPDADKAPASSSHRMLQSPFDMGYFSVGSPSVCTANSQYGSSGNLSGATTTAGEASEQRINQVAAECLPDTAPGSNMTSTSTSPTGAPAKRPRIISNGSDLLEEMRERYSFTRGADMYARQPQNNMMPPPPVQRPRMSPGPYRFPQTSTAQNFQFTGQQAGPGPQVPQASHEGPTPPGVFPSSCLRPGQSQQYGSCPDLSPPKSQHPTYQQTPYNSCGMRGSADAHTPYDTPQSSHNMSFSAPNTPSKPRPNMAGPAHQSARPCQNRPNSLKPTSLYPQQQPTPPMHPNQSQMHPNPSQAHQSQSMYPNHTQMYPGQSHTGQGQMHPGQGQMHPGQGQMHGGQTQLQPNQSQMHMGQSQMNPGQSQMHQGQSQMHPGHSQMHNGPSQMHSGNSQMHPGQSQMNPGYSQMNTGHSQMNPGHSQMNPGHSQMHPGHSQMNPGQSQMHPGQSQMNPGQSQMNPGQSDVGGLLDASDRELLAQGTSHMAEGLPLSQNGFMQSLISNRSGAFRSHPLFPLLRDLIIADMNFHSPSFPFPLIANLPADFDRLLQNYLSRNQPMPNHQSNDAVQGVIMDALKYAHSALIDKIRGRKVKEGYTESQKPLSAIEDFCERFDRAVKNTIKPEPEMPGVPNTMSPGLSSMPPQTGYPYPHQVPHTPDYLTPPYTPAHHKAPPQFQFADHLQERRSQSLPPSPRKTLHSFMPPPHHPGHMMGGRGEHTLSDFNLHLTGKRSHEQTHSSGGTGKNKVLPKEAVQLMLDWLRQHQDNPYPNDDEKDMLISKTKLTINQINYWFTNARRRILPKWALQRYMEQQDKQKQEAAEKKTEESVSSPQVETKAVS